MKCSFVQPVCSGKESRWTTSVNRRRIARWLATVAWGWPAAVFALGVRIPNQDPAAIARGNAFVATADNPSALYYNPAGITQLEGHNFQAGSLFYLNIYADHASPNGTRTKNDTEIIPVPDLHYVFSPKNSPLSYGLGLYAPFGLGMKWPEQAPFATAGLEGRLTYLTVNPVLAWQVHPTLSLALGPNFNYSHLKLRQAIGLIPGDEFEFKGDNWGYGFNAGLRWQPHEKWSFGLTYRSAVRMNYKGTASTRPSPPFPAPVPTSAPIDFPQIIAGGISFRPTTHWNIEVNADWTDWHSVDQLNIKGVSSRPLAWHSSFLYEFGVTRYLPKGYFVSAGYFFSENSTSERFFLPVIPDSDLHVLSLGGGHKGKNWSWAVAGQLIGGDWRTVDNAAAPSVNGRYRLFTPTLSMSVGYRF